MKGTILGFDPDTNSGAISGDDGQRYRFATIDWRGPGRPNGGMAVDFVAQPGGRATQMYPVAGSSDPAAGDTANIVYILYLVSLITGITAIVGLVIAYVNRGEAPDWLKTHYRFQIRTFWIGLLYGFISLLTLIVVVGLLLGIFTLIWWIVRCAKGMKQLARGTAYENPATWLW